MNRYLLKIMMILTGIFLSFSGMTQTIKEGNNSFNEVGIETQIYPAGVINSVRWMKPLNNRSGFLVSLGYNTARRQDFGKHNDEKGGGPGFAAGYKYYFKNEGMSGFFVSARIDVWFLSIDWKDERSGIEEKGSSNITVLQPVISGGYQYVTDTNWAFEASIAFGREWNMVTKGEEVGQGGISLAVISVAKRF